MVNENQNFRTRNCNIWSTYIHINDYFSSTTAKIQEKMFFTGVALMVNNNQNFRTRNNNIWSTYIHINDYLSAGACEQRKFKKNIFRRRYQIISRTNDDFQCTQIDSEYVD